MKNKGSYFGGSTKPYTRWWWLQGPILDGDIECQLDWIKANGFGGVEIAWLCPHWLGSLLTLTPGPKWLSDDWSDVVRFAKQYASSIGLGCDFTFGSCWPFGGSFVEERDAAQTFTGPSQERLRGSWEDYTGSTCRVVNHLGAKALRTYAGHLLPALAGALAGDTSALFCDSLEIDRRNLWTTELWDVFEREYGYRLEPYVVSLHLHPDVRYDYRCLLADVMLREFFMAFTEICHEAGALSRVQCHGAPVDLLSAYAAVDIPESETVLFSPSFSRIPASAAILAGKPVVSAEAFTCIYGFSHYDDPALKKYWKKERVKDLKLLADAIFAQGVNQVVWHGMPYHAPGDSNEFYAAVHVGPDSALAPHLPSFNAYLERVSSLLQQGQAYTNLAVYLPNEDNWMQHRYEEPMASPSAHFTWEMHHVKPPPETDAFHPVWVSRAFLERAGVRDSQLVIGNAVFSGLYVDCEWLDRRAVADMLQLARQGVRVVLKRWPKQPGRNPDDGYEQTLSELTDMPSVYSHVHEAGIRPLIDGEDIPWYWARQNGEDLYLFVAHPAVRGIEFPVDYNMSAGVKAMDVPLVVNWSGKAIPLKLRFRPAESFAVRVSVEGDFEFLDMGAELDVWP